ncbi:hypothetical protein J6590_091371 [Homalodisca vitripennis]|nr:hypothetical protein J6590_091371 [Homalodisca vitripennis]
MLKTRFWRAWHFVISFLGTQSLSDLVTCPQFIVVRDDLVTYPQFIVVREQLFFFSSILGLPVWRRRLYDKVAGAEVLHNYLLPHPLLTPTSEVAARPSTNKTVLPHPQAYW